MAKILTKDELSELGGEVVFEQQGPARIEGLETLVAELRALVTAQRESLGMSGDQSANHAELVKSIKALVGKVGSAAPARNDASQKVLEAMLVQLAEMPRGEREANPVYVFNIERSAMGYITKIVATPTPAGA